MVQKDFITKLKVPKIPIDDLRANVVRINKFKALQSNIHIAQEIYRPWSLYRQIKGPRSFSRPVDAQGVSIGELKAQEDSID